MASRDNVFAPNPTATVLLSCGTSTANVQFRNAPPTTGGAGDQPGTLNLTNASTTITAFVKLGTSSAVAATVPGAFSAPGDFAIPPATRCTIDMGNATWIAGITSSSTASVYVTPGQGTV